ncbi:unnamed protein product [Caenorhabditis auriculariae]|uniref:PRORP domain-containing protein n=1 Tax=Caenorhabditis auriculariae TaxID=2777116 RepID=A0A8S1GPZ8_9PELO|nr:unnamed protein product [Caenorhabditis auriculariae]
MSDGEKTLKKTVERSVTRQIHGLLGFEFDRWKNRLNRPSGLAEPKEKLSTRIVQHLGSTTLFAKISLKGTSRTSLNKVVAHLRAARFRIKSSLDLSFRPPIVPFSSVASHTSPSDFPIQYRFLRDQNKPSFELFAVGPTLDFVLRAKLYNTKEILDKCLRTVQECLAQKLNSPKIVSSSAKFLACVYWQGPSERRSEVLELAEAFSNYRNERFAEIGLFLNSVLDPKEFLRRISDEPPKMIIHPNELSLCVGLCSLQYDDFKTAMVFLRPKPFDQTFHELVVKGVCQKIKENKISNKEIFSWTMSKLLDSNLLTIESETYAATVGPIIELSCKSTKEARENGSVLILPSGKKFDRLELIDSESFGKLCNDIDVRYKSGNQGLISWIEVKKALEEVRKIKKSCKSKKGEGVVVVDAYNFGNGSVPKKPAIDRLKASYKTVVLVVRHADVATARLLSPHVLSASRLSSDDIIVIRAALEFGPLAHVVSRDLYRDHRGQLKPEVDAIWNRWFTDAVHTCNSTAGVVEPKRNFSRRVHRLDDGTFLIPVFEKLPNISQYKYLIVSAP